MKRVVFFAHYDPDGIIDEYVVRYMQAIIDSGAERVLFSSDSVLAVGERDKLPAAVEVVCAARHGEYDFGSWKRCFLAMAAGELEAYDELILCNDSCYNALQPLSRVFDEMDGRDCDFWGILQVKKMGGYYPSFFLGFRRPVLAWPGFVDFFMSVGSFCEKKAFCQKYEVGLTRMLEEQGFRGDCLLNQFEDLCHSSAAALADDVVAAGMPFIRVMMARRNPGGAAHLGEKLAKVCDQSGYPLSVIDNHLERTSPDYRKYWNCRIADQTYHCLGVIKARTKPNIKKGKFRLKVWLLGIPLLSLSLPMRGCCED